MSSQSGVTWDFIKTKKKYPDSKIWQDNGSSDRFSLDPFWRCRPVLFTAICVYYGHPKFRKELRAVRETRCSCADSLKWSASGKNPTICRRHPCRPVIYACFHPSPGRGPFFWYYFCSPSKTPFARGVDWAICEPEYSWFYFCVHWFGSCQRGCSNFMADWVKCILINDRSGFSLKTIKPWNLRTSGVCLIKDQGWTYFGRRLFR